MKLFISIWLGKITVFISRIAGLGAGSTWPGHLALILEPSILAKLTSQLKKGVILVAGTNGKTTTAALIKKILENSPSAGGWKLGVINNEEGANLLNGFVSTLINACNLRGRINADWAIFETDEATLPLALKEFTPKIIVLLNLFRDQLDRYGEVDLIADKWLEVLKNLGQETTFIVNADDPNLAFIGKNLKTNIFYFGLEDQSLFLSKMQHAVDSIYCPNCQEKLEFEGVYFSHLGKWECLQCGLKRPKPDLRNWHNWSNLKGVYNRYNTLAAVLTAKTIGINEESINKTLTDFHPVFGRQEELHIDCKKIRILLSKNPAGFNESLRSLGEFPEKEKTVLLVLNDRIPDGRDVSWIWDVDFEMIPEDWKIIVSGERVLDMGLRIKYSLHKLTINNLQFTIETNLKKAINMGLGEIEPEETLYILATYSAMLEVRKIIGGRKLL